MTSLETMINLFKWSFSTITHFVYLEMFSDKNIDKA